MTKDWRERRVNLADLIKKLYHGPPEIRESFTDVTFVLDDNSEIKAHKMILALASPMFEAKFYGPLADRNQDTFKVTEVEAGTFRNMLTFVYSSGYIEDCDASIGDNSEMYWSLLEAAHFFLLEGLIDHCHSELKKIMHTIKSPEGQIQFLNNASSLSIFNDLMEIGMEDFITKLPQFIMEGFNQRQYPVSFNKFISSIEKFSMPAIEVLIKTYDGVTETTKHIEKAQSTRILIENYLEKNGSKELKIEEEKEKLVVHWFSVLTEDYGAFFNDHNSKIIQSHFRKQPWKELYENLFKDALPFLKQKFGNTSANKVFKTEEGVLHLILWSVVGRWLSCPLWMKDYGWIDTREPDFVCLNFKENSHCRHW